jgi:hypothetical protein
MPDKPCRTSDVLTLHFLQVNFIDGRERQLGGGSKGFVSGLRKSLNLQGWNLRLRVVRRLLIFPDTHKNCAFFELNTVSSC